MRSRTSERRALARLGAGLLAAAALVCGGCSGTKERPNLILYVVDTLRADSLGCYGNPYIETPHFDALAAEGLLFEQVFANASWTRASMASLVTGLYPTRHLTQGRWDALPESVHNLAQMLWAAGYATAFVNTNPNAGSFFGFSPGFGEMIELYGRRKVGYVGQGELVTRSDEVTRRALEWVEQAPRPFFLLILTTDPHAPYVPPEGFDRYRDDQAQWPVQASHPPSGTVPSDEVKRRFRALYDGEVSFNDDSFGALMGGLRSRGVLEDTIVVLTSDHGEEFWEHGIHGHGQSLSELVTRVPLVICYPRSPRVPAGERVASPVELVDLVPTLLDLLSIEIPPDLDGRSLLGGTRDAKRPLFAHLDVDHTRLASLRDPPLKLVWDLATGERVLLDLEAGERVVPSPQRAEDRERLSKALEALLARGSSDASPVRVEGEMPKDIEDALRALGYIED